MQIDFKIKEETLNENEKTRVWFYNERFSNVLGADIADEKNMNWHIDFLADRGLNLYYVDSENRLAGVEEAEIFLKNMLEK